MSNNFLAVVLKRLSGGNLLAAGDIRPRDNTSFAS